MKVAPTDIRALSDQAKLRITWSDGRVTELGFVRLRAACNCAACVNEWTGEAILDPATIPADIRIEKLAMVGNYAVRIAWSDGHNTGLYTWQRLRELASAE